MIDFAPVTKKRVNGASDESRLLKILEEEQQIRYSISQTIEFPDPLITLNGQGFIYQNTINVIQGKAGSHKSRLTELLCSCMLADIYGDKFLGFRSWVPDEGIKLIYADTERNLRDQYPYALQSIIRNADRSLLHPPKDLHHISLINTNRSERFEILELYLKYMRQKTDKHLFVVLDVVTDCIENFNDPNGTMRFIDFLNRMINNHGVTFLCVIHENPGSSDKARGHLGTEIMNKASMQLQIGYEKDRNQNDTDLIRVKFLKTRMIKRPDPMYLTFSQEQKKLVLADDELVNQVNRDRQQKASMEEIGKSLVELLSEPTERQIALDSLTDLHNCSISTVKSRLSNLFSQNSIIEDSSGKPFRIVQERSGKNLIYSRIPV